MKIFKVLLLVGVGFYLSACGGGGGGSGNKSTSDKSFLVTASAGSGGSVNVASATVAQNSTTSFSFTADTGYHIKSVTGCSGALTGNNFVTGAVISSCMVSAIFEANTYNISVIASGGGSYSLQNESVAYGEKGKLIALPNAGFGVDKFSGCGNGTTNYSTYTTAEIISDCSVELTFKKVVTLQGTAAEGAALINAKVVANCSDGSTFTTKVETDATGHFTGQVGETALPCALSATVDDPAKTFYSVVTQAGTINITSLTDLSLTLASGKTGADWFASSDWKDAIPKLTEVQASIKATLLNIGYDIPSGDFLPFVTDFEVGDAWDVLLDQLRESVEKTERLKTYDTLVSLIKNGDIYSLPSPDGDEAQTADACFNPDLFTEGTTYTITTERSGSMTENDITTPTITSDSVIHTIKRMADENGLLIVADEWSGVTVTDGWTSKSKGISKSTVDFSAKTLTTLSFYGENLDGAGNSSNYHFNGSYTNSANIYRFKYPKDKTWNEEFNFRFDFYATFLGSEPYDTSSFSSFIGSKKFIGITEIVRNGTRHKVCEFEIRYQRTPIDGGGNVMGEVESQNNSEYFLVGSGIDITDEGIKSAILNGKELLNGEPN